jgi:hypothetical protein
MRRNQISSYCVWNVMAHAQKPDFVLLRMKCDGTCAETRFHLTAFEMYWHIRINQISSYCVWNIMAHAQKPDFILLRLKCIGTCAETRFRHTAFEMWWHMRRNQISFYCVWNVMAHTQKSNFFFRRDGRVHLNLRGLQFSGLLAGEVRATAVVMLDTPCSEVVWRVLLPTPIASFPFISPPVLHRVPSHFNWTLLTPNGQFLVCAIIVFNEGYNRCYILYTFIIYYVRQSFLYKLMKILYDVKLPNIICHYSLCSNMAIAFRWVVSPQFHLDSLLRRLRQVALLPSSVRT